MTSSRAPLDGVRVLLGVSGGIAAYKAADELAAEPEFDVTVVNDDLERAAREVIEIVDKLRRRTIDNDHSHVKEPKHA